MKNVVFWHMKSCTPENSAASILTVEDGRIGSPRTVGKDPPHYMQVPEHSTLYITECRAVSRQQLGKHFPAATDTHAPTEALLEAGFSTVVRAEEV
jgi:hypothetical protein